MPSTNKYNLRSKQKLRISKNKYKERPNIFELLEAWLFETDDFSLHSHSEKQWLASTFG